MSDYISRQDAIEKIQNDPIGRMLAEDYNLIGFLEGLPSVEPETSENGSSDVKSAGNGENRTINDLISRQAAIEAIIKRDANCGIDSADVLRKLPSAQPEIIRCKDCRHWQKRGLCGVWDHYISNGEFYCGCGEREDGTE